MGKTKTPAKTPAKPSTQAPAPQADTTSNAAMQEQLAAQGPGPQEPLPEWMQDPELAGDSDASAAIAAIRGLRDVQILQAQAVYRYTQANLLEYAVYTEGDTSLVPSGGAIGEIFGGAWGNAWTDGYGFLLDVGGFALGGIVGLALSSFLATCTEIVVEGVMSYFSDPEESEEHQQLRGQIEGYAAMVDAAVGDMMTTISAANDSADLMMDLVHGRVDALSALTTSELATLTEQVQGQAAAMRKQLLPSTGRELFHELLRQWVQQNAATTDTPSDNLTRSQQALWRKAAGNETLWGSDGTFRGSVGEDAQGCPAVYPGQVRGILGRLGLDAKPADACELAAYYGVEPQTRWSGVRVVDPARFAAALRERWKRADATEEQAAAATADVTLTLGHAHKQQGSIMATIRYWEEAIVGALTVTPTVPDASNRRRERTLDPLDFHP